jgi:hypothetical protein
MTAIQAVFINITLGCIAIILSSIAVTLARIASMMVQREFTSTWKEGKIVDTQSARSR